MKQTSGSVCNICNMNFQIWSIGRYFRYFHSWAKTILEETFSCRKTPVPGTQGPFSCSAEQRLPPHKPCPTWGGYLQDNRVLPHEMITGEWYRRERFWRWTWWTICYFHLFLFAMAQVLGETARLTPTTAACWAILQMGPGFSWPHCECCRFIFARWVLKAMSMNSESSGYPQNGRLRS